MARDPVDRVLEHNLETPIPRYDPIFQPQGPEDNTPALVSYHPDQHDINDFRPVTGDDT